jgi:hypothetical protein
MANVLDAQLLADGLGGYTADEPDDDADDDARKTGRDDAPGSHEHPAYDFVIAWNVIVRKYRNLLQQRAGRRAKSKKPGPEES